MLAFLDDRVIEHLLQSVEVDRVSVLANWRSVVRYAGYVEFEES